MTFRKPLKGMDENTEQFGAFLRTDSSIRPLSQSNKAFRHFQLPLHQTDATVASAKQHSIHQSYPRTSRLNRPETTISYAKEVIYTKSWRNQQRKDKKQQKQHEQQEELEQHDQQQQEQNQSPQLSPTQSYFFWTKETPTQQSEHSSLYDLTPLNDDDDTLHQRADEKTLQNIECEQQHQHTTTLCMESSTMGRSSPSLKRQYPESDQQTRRGISDQSSLQPLTNTFSLSTPTRNFSHSPPFKRHHCLESLPRTPLDAEAQQNVQLPMTPFIFENTSARDKSTPPDLEHHHTTEPHPQTPPDTKAQPPSQLQRHLQPLTTEFEFYTPPSSASLAHMESHETRSTERHNAPLSPPPLQLDHLRDSQPTVVKSRVINLSQSWESYWENLSQDLSQLRHLPQNVNSPTQNVNSPTQNVNSPTQNVNSPTQNVNSPTQNLNLPPVFKLNDDCLTEILKWCATPQTLHDVSLVCKHWRNLALQPYVWRTINYTWDCFVQQLEPKSSLSRGRRRTGPLKNYNSNSYNNNNDLLLSSPLVYIRTIMINNIQGSKRRFCGTPTSSIFTNLCTLQLSTMHFKDILDVITWTNHLKVLDCKNILTVDSNDRVMIAPFSELRKLNSLKLHFASMCELIGPTSLSSSMTGGNNITRRTSTNRWLFPPNLRILKITNVYDIEEFLTSSDTMFRVSNRQQQQQQQQPTTMTAERMEKLVESWNQMETTLIHKYRILATLAHLTNLSLGYCTAYTARIWRECVTPATKHLTRLTLCGWNGDGNREAPLAWKERHDMASMTDTSVDLYMEDVEKALAEMLAGLHNLDTLTLLQFKCTIGVIHGMELLTEATGKSFKCNSLQAINNNDTSSVITRDKSYMASTSSSPMSLKDWLDWHLLKTKLKLCDGSSSIVRKNKRKVVG